LPPLQDLNATTPPPPILRYAYRSFDRQWVLLDNRLGDRLRPILWQIHSDEQVYFTSLLTGAIGSGPAATAAADVPDLHHFRGSYGGADVIPLWRDRALTRPNVTTGLLDALAKAIGHRVSARTLFAYCYGILASHSYNQAFTEELITSGPRIPLTTDRELFRSTVSLGRRLVWLHTYGERWRSSEDPDDAIPQGDVRCAHPVGGQRYPNAFYYDYERRSLFVDEGIFSPVSPEVWDFSVSGLNVVNSWLGYRMASRSGRRSSKLDDIHPRRWTASLNEELLQLLWLLEATIALHPALENNLDRVLASRLMNIEDLPRPASGERRPPRPLAPFQEAMVVDEDAEPLAW